MEGMFDDLWIALGIVAAVLCGLSFGIGVLIGWWLL